MWRTPFRPLAFLLSMASLIALIRCSNSAFFSSSSARLVFALASMSLAEPVVMDLMIPCSRLAVTLGL